MYDNIEEISSITDVLLKNYMLFLYSYVRDNAWEDLFKQHLNAHYIDTPRTYNSKRTNLPRTIFQNDRLSWDVYHEGLVILSRMYDSMHIEFELAHKDKFIRKFSLPVLWHGDEQKVGEDIKHKGRADKVLVVKPDLNRDGENELAFVVRELMRTDKLTRIQLDKMLEAYAEDPDNLNTFSSKSLPGIKSSILGTMYRRNIAWQFFTRALCILGYTDMSITINAVRGARNCQTTTNMGLV